MIRELIEAVKNGRSNGDAIAPDNEIANWLEWASQQADRLDPLRVSPASILDEDIDLDEPMGGYRRSW